MVQLLEYSVTPLIQGILGVGAFLSGAVMLYLSSKMGKRDERIEYIDLKGTNVMLWAFFALIFVLFLLKPSDVQIYQKFILNSFFIAMIIGGVYSIYQYKIY